MRALPFHWSHGLAGFCALTTVALLVWPMASPAIKHDTPTPSYAGPAHPARRASPVVGLPIRLTYNAGPAAVVTPAAEAVPALVGISGRSAYLRSAATGEVERVQIGQTIDGWRLVAVSARTATLRGASGDRRLEMFAAASPEAGPTFAPDPAPNVMVPPPEGG